METKSFFGSGSPDQLRRFLERADSEESWSATDLAELWRQQLELPLELEPAGLSPTEVEHSVAALLNERLLVRSLRDVLAMPAPPLALLRGLKDWAKSALANKQRNLPEQTLHAIYWLSVALSLIRHQIRLTSLEDQQLRNGMEWLASQNWLDAESLACAKAELLALDSSRASGQ
jgi:hypothetical protein